MENSEINVAAVIEKLGFVRIGTNYYKMVEKPNTDGSKERKLIAWIVECIKADYGKDFVAKISKLDGFCLFPNHFDFEKSWVIFIISTTNLTTFPKRQV